MSRSEALLKDAFLRKVDRGGLLYPTEEVYMSSLAAWSFYQEIRQNQDASALLFGQTSAKHIFVKCMMGLKSSTNYLDIQCSSGHKFDNIFGLVVVKMFNIFMRNLCTETNSEAHAQKKRKAGDASQRKVKKLQSESV